MGSILLVHGTGVRLPSYQQSMTQAIRVAKHVGVSAQIHPCAWGDCLGSFHAWKSLPCDSDESQVENRDLENWSWLFESPYHELVQYSSEAVGLTDAAKSGLEHEGHDQLNRITKYSPSVELRLLLERGGLTDSWDKVWNASIGNPITTSAFENYDQDLENVTRAFVRSVVAQLHNDATAHGIAGPSRQIRSDLVDRLLVDLGQYVLSGSIIGRLAAKALTYCIRKSRSQLSRASALIIGDILLYQSKGDRLLEYLRQKISELGQPVTVVAHSLGGIAMVDLLATGMDDHVDKLVTVGSQAPFLNEMGALRSLRAGEPLPEAFPRWLNIFDQNDFLSFRAEPVWDKAEDLEVDSGQPFPDSHLAYFGNPEVWEAIKRFVQ